MGTESQPIRSFGAYGAGRRSGQAAFVEFAASQAQEWTVEQIETLAAVVESADRRIEELGLQLNLSRVRATTCSTCSSVMRRGVPGAGFVGQTVDTVPHEARAPLADGGGRHVHRPPGRPAHRCYAGDDRSGRRPHRVRAVGGVRAVRNAEGGWGLLGATSGRAVRSTLVCVLRMSSERPGTCLGCGCMHSHPQWLESTERRIARGP